MFVRNVISSDGKSDIDTATPRSQKRILSTPLEVFKEIFSPYKVNGETFLNHMILDTVESTVPTGRNRSQLQKC